MQVIAKAKVPIIKFTETASSFAFDVSFDVADGPVAGEYVAELMAELPPMKPLVLVLKIFLQQRDFNEVSSVDTFHRGRPSHARWETGHATGLSSGIDVRTMPSSSP